MATTKKNFLTELTAGEMKRLLAARERIDVLESERAKLSKALEKIDGELARLMAGADGRTATVVQPRRKKAGRKKAAGKKATVKKTTAKKVGAKKTGRKKAAGKKVVAAKKTTGAKAKGKVKLEDVVVKVIKAHGEPMGFKDLIGVIVKKKLFVTKSKNFDNVLRRTLSTSKLVKRAGRGIYKLA